MKSTAYQVYAGCEHPNTSPPGDPRRHADLKALRTLHADGFSPTAPAVRTLSRKGVS
jgi:hypothetical protein